MTFSAWFPACPAYVSAIIDRRRTARVLDRLIRATVNSTSSSNDRSGTPAEAGGRKPCPQLHHRDPAKAGESPCRPVSSCSLAAASGSSPPPMPSIRSRAAVQNSRAAEKAALRHVTASAGKDRPTGRIESGRSANPSRHGAWRTATIDCADFISIALLVAPGSLNARFPPFFFSGMSLEWVGVWDRRVHLWTVLRGIRLCDKGRDERVQNRLLDRVGKIAASKSEPEAGLVSTSTSARACSALISPARRELQSARTAR